MLTLKVFSSTRWKKQTSPTLILWWLEKWLQPAFMRTWSLISVSFTGHDLNPESLSIIRRFDVIPFALQNFFPMFYK
jgi:hypothetical protein